MELFTGLFCPIFGFFCHFFPLFHKTFCKSTSSNKTPKEMRTTFAMLSLAFAGPTVSAFSSSARVFGRRLATTAIPAIRYVPTPTAQYCYVYFLDFLLRFLRCLIYIHFKNWQLFIFYLTLHHTSLIPLIYPQPLLAHHHPTTFAALRSLERSERSLTGFSSSPTALSSPPGMTSRLVELTESTTC